MCYLRIIQNETVLLKWGWKIIHNDGFHKASFSTMNSNKSVWLLFMIPELLNNNSTYRISLDQFWPGLTAWKQW